MDIRVQLALVQALLDTPLHGLLQAGERLVDLVVVALEEAQQEPVLEGLLLEGPHDDGVLGLGSEQHGRLLGKLVEGLPDP